MSREPKLLVDDLARSARRLSVEEFVSWLEDPFLLWVGPERGGRESLFDALHTTEHTPRSRSVSPADFLEHVVVAIPRTSAALTVGRGRDCDVRIPHESVSTRHARLLPLEDRGLSIEDLGSRNGTFARGALVPAQRRVRVRHGDSVQVGARVFKVYEPSRLYLTLKRIVPTAF